MRHKFDRGRCGSCASANRPPREWPVFRFCPYCGRDLGSKTSEETEEKKQEEKRMEKYVWNADQDHEIREMILAGKTVADICDRMGCTDSQLKNHVAVVRRRDPSFPTLCGEVKGARFVLASSEAAAVLAGESGQIVVDPANEETVEPIKEASLNPLEKEMADIITENNATIENLRIDLETEKESRELEAEAYRKEINRLQDLVNALRETVSAQGDEMAAKDKLIEKVYGDLDRARIERDEAQNLLRLQRENDETEWATPEEERALSNGVIDAQRKELASALDEAANLSDMLHERDEVIFAMAKAIFLGPKEVLLA